jgi:hypothetical protein
MGDKMSLTKSAIAEAIKAELIRDQAELQEIQKRLVDLEERARVNRAWLKAYGFLETGTPPPAAPPAIQAETNLKHLVLEPLSSDSAPEATNPAGPPGNSSPAIDAEPVPTVLKNEKSDGRKELYEALISRGARIG